MKRTTATPTPTKMATMTAMRILFLCARALPCRIEGRSTYTLAPSLRPACTAVAGVRHAWQHKDQPAATAQRQQRHDHQLDTHSPQHCQELAAGRLPSQQYSYQCRASLQCSCTNTTARNEHGTNQHTTHLHHVTAQPSVCLPLKLTQLLISFRYSHSSIHGNLLLLRAWTTSMHCCAGGQCVTSSNWT